MDVSFFNKEFYYGLSLVSILRNYKYVSRCFLNRMNITEGRFIPISFYLIQEKLVNDWKGHILEMRKLVTK